ncbi:MAG: 16S rRNA (guanine(527)-N(7))-methyltransferase RsmG [Rhodospirillaceae bacterium]|nr:MAG: 16S rRNA (guanine(527)-N(7))-methyltransferase RsmG [Rhodospirillaceae bacterium]
MDSPAPSPPLPLKPAEFQALTNVSRETFARLATYLQLLTRWQKSINLVGGRSLADPWRRHFLDSAQLLPLLPEGAQSLVDLGSGAGFPGLVLGILGVPQVHLVESDARKCAFLREAARETGVSVEIHNARIENLTPWRVDVVVSRALAPLSRLLLLAHPFLGLGAEGLFLKGKAAFEELTEAEKSWKMAVETISSKSDPDGVILRLGDVQHAPRHAK